MEVRGKALAKLHTVIIKSNKTNVGVRGDWGREKEGVVSQVAGYKFQVLAPVDAESPLMYTRSVWVECYQWFAFFV